MPFKREYKWQRAAIGWLADDEISIQTLSNVEKNVVERIRKCFDRGNHAAANENEQRAAFKMAHRIMKQYNISQAELMEEEDKVARAQRGGMSTVNIWPAKDASLVKHQTWVNDLVCAIRKFFDCSAYSTSLLDNIEWTFYGVVGHTVSAAMAFGSVHNQIQTWAGKYPTVATRNSYSLGVADGLCRLADEEQVAMENIAMETEQKALAARIRAEDIQRQVELDRLRNLPASPSPEPFSEPEEEEGATEDKGNVDAIGSDDDDSDNEAMPDFKEVTPGEKMDATADFDTELKKFIKPEPKPECEPTSFTLYEKREMPFETEKPVEYPTPPSEDADEEEKPKDRRMEVDASAHSFPSERQGD